ncbi:MAG: YbhB/YbcL family Raf kinase inhibitor-like protein [Methanocorpusculum sp.]|nr:YbhB/YbcL family Raf kinase inhibitor-like protein [Methanocorpusculum sp.]MDE2522526.1 YbhB/YbcL family Raf kinase inhibitor-like protein [Methanocorpusculum sp.]MDE2524221.1 YbhB/YbcL family Raf kinase inhibitor-like protein [Methanocorpusculum sp.]
MQQMTIHLGSSGITPSSTFSGGNISPKIDLTGVPAEVKYVAAIVQNKSGEGKMQCIWSIWNIPSVGYIPPGYEQGPVPGFPFPAVQGVNDFGEHGWHGPEPKLGSQERMLFQVFGRAEPISISADAKMDEVIEALRDGKTIAYGSLESIYFV